MYKSFVKFGMLISILGANLDLDPFRLRYHTRTLICSNELNHELTENKRRHCTVI